jgi:hypothetical protein
MSCPGRRPCPGRRISNGRNTWAASQFRQLASARARKNYAATSPITRQSGKRKTVMARYVHTDRLRDALDGQAFAALTASPGARACYDAQRARGAGHRPALRHLASRLTGILHGCLKAARATTRQPRWPQSASQHTSSAA